MKVTIHLFNRSSTDNPDGQVGLGKGHLALLLVLLPLLVVVDLVLAHIYSAWAAIVTAIPAVKTLVQLWRTALDQVVLQLVLPRKALVTVVTRTSVGSFPRVQQLVPGHMLWTGELLATDITGVFVVHLGAVRLHVLCQLAQLEELLSTLVAREHPVISIAGTRKLGMASASMSRQPSFGGEGLKASRSITVKHGEPISPSCKCQRLHS